MSRFFNVSAILCSAMLVSALVVGQFQLLTTTQHLLLGLTAAIFSTALHCLIFGIFTGSGKDTRELVQDLGINQEWVGKTKAFRKNVFPPALYAIVLLVMTSVFGGALSAKGGWLRWVHFGLAWFTVAYNLKAFFTEAKAVSENSRILARVNQEASTFLNTHPDVAKGVPDVAGLIPAATEIGEWGQHVFALGKFLCFLGWNTWLVFIYLRFIVGYFMMPVWPYLLVSACFLGGGYYLRLRYQSFRPSAGSASPH